jgi:hypothetical protein
MGLFSNNNNQEVLGKLRQVLNEVLVLKEEEAARSIELIKQLGALNEKVGLLSAKMSEANAKIAGLNKRVDELHQLEGFIKNGATKTMMEMLGKKVNEIGKTVDDHFESFVKVSETDSELFKLIAQALTGKVMEEDEESTKDKGQGTKEAEKTVSGTDGDGGKERKTVVIHGYIDANYEKGAFFFSESIEEFLEKNGFKYISCPKKGFRELSFRKTLRKGERRKSLLEVKDGIVFDSLLAKDLESRFASPFACVLFCNSHYCKISFKK